MKFIIFAGGAGTRLWPLSRRNSPKQFEKILEGKSTLELALSRIKKYGSENIFISTNRSYKSLVFSQAKTVPKQNVFFEPARRDLAAAVGLTLVQLKKRGITGPIAILWADHLMERVDEFRLALEKGKKLIEQNPNRFIFLAEEPRFPNHNLGWIHKGKNIETNQYKFLGWKYRPEKKQCEKMFESREWMWNPGYFISDIDFVLSLYEKFMPEMYEKLCAMSKNTKKIESEYPKLESISFDNAIVEKLGHSQAVVLQVNMGWSDPGTLYAMKEALVKEKNKNYVKGNITSIHSTDSFLYNEENGKILAGIGLEGMIVVNTKDAILVCPKDQVPEIKHLLQKLEEEGNKKFL